LRLREAGVDDDSTNMQAQHCLLQLAINESRTMFSRDFVLVLLIP
jgi:hypothetical protein